EAAEPLTRSLVDAGSMPAARKRQPRDCLHRFAPPLHLRKPCARRPERKADRIPSVRSHLCAAAPESPACPVETEAALRLLPESPRVFERSAPLRGPVD